MKKFIIGIVAGTVLALGLISGAWAELLTYAAGQTTVNQTQAVPVEYTIEEAATPTWSDAVQPAPPYANGQQRPYLSQPQTVKRPAWTEPIKEGLTTSGGRNK